MANKDLSYWKQNAEEDYIGTPISVLRYISELEKHTTLPSNDYCGVHLRHCYQREYEGCCKYGEDDCPAKPLETHKQQDNG